MRAKRAKAIRRAARTRVETPSPSAGHGRLPEFTLKFLVATALTMIPLSLTPEAWFSPLNRLTALLVAEVLRLWALSPVLQNTAIGLDAFRVNVIAECSAVHPIALLAAFVHAFPSSRREKWIGALAGAGILFSVNILRIALVTLIGRYLPAHFEIAHIYFGQLGMLAMTMTTCLAWCRWIHHPERLNGSAGFLVRFLLFSGIPFLIWLPLNRAYIGVIDGLIQGMFSLADLRLVIPHAHTMYYQTFSIVALVGLLMAVKGASLGRRLRWMAMGIAALTVLQIVFRLCNVWISAFDLSWVTPISQVVYNSCVYLLPLGIAQHFLMRSADDDRKTGRSKV